LAVEIRPTRCAGNICPKTWFQCRTEQSTAVLG
jgi:hypothetical protein